VVKGHPPFEVPPGPGAPPSSDPLALLNWALQYDPGSVELVNFAKQTELSVFEPGPAVDGHVLVTICMPEEVATDLAGPPEQQNAYILIQIDRRAVDAMDEPPLIIQPFGLLRPDL